MDEMICKKDWGLNPSIFPLPVDFLSYSMPAFAIIILHGSRTVLDRKTERSIEKFQLKGQGCLVSAEDMLWISL